MVGLLGDGGGGFSVADGAVEVWAVAVHGRWRRLGRRRVGGVRLVVVVVRLAVAVRVDSSAGESLLSVRRRLRCPKWCHR